MTFHLIDFYGVYAPILAINLSESQVEAIKKIKSGMTLSQFAVYDTKNYYDYSEIKNIINEKIVDFYTI